MSPAADEMQVEASMPSLHRRRPAVHVVASEPGTVTLEHGPDVAGQWEVRD